MFMQVKGQVLVFKEKYYKWCAKLLCNSMKNMKLPISRLYFSILDFVSHLGK